MVTHRCWGARGGSGGSDEGERERARGPLSGSDCSQSAPDDPPQTRPRGGADPIKETRGRNNKDPPTIGGGMGLGESREG